MTNWSMLVSEEKSSGPHAALVAAFVLVDIVTVLGNFLIILSVLCTPKLRTVTNCFILSLGIADFLVGLCVLPPAIIMQLTHGVWPLGVWLCGAWLSLDVLLCTASILSLCAISIDRYLAISRPFSYSKMRRSKPLAAKIIAGVWMLSALVTCPLFFSWTGFEESVLADGHCRFEGSLGYVVYSALGSFYLPLLVILYTYTRVIIVVQSRNKEFKRQVSERRLRGRELEESKGPSIATPTMTMTTTTTTMTKKKREVSKMASLRVISSEGNDITSTALNIDLDNESWMGRSDLDLSSCLDNITPSSSNVMANDELEDVSKKRDAHGQKQVGAGNLLSVCSSSGMHLRGSRGVRGSESRARPFFVLGPSENSIKWHFVDLSDCNKESPKTFDKDSNKCSICGTRTTADSLIHLTFVEEASSITEPDLAVTTPDDLVASQLRSSSASRLLSRRMRRVYSQRHMHLREAKTAKRLAVVVCFFITCWLPFFVVYLAAPFVDTHTFPTPSLHIWLTWLGWGNSAVNPFLYASYSPSFRSAFFDLTFGLLIDLTHKLWPANNNANNPGKSNNIENSNINM